MKQSGEPGIPVFLNKLFSQQHLTPWKCERFTTKNAYMGNFPGFSQRNRYQKGSIGFRKQHTFFQLNNGTATHEHLVCFKAWKHTL